MRVIYKCYDKDWSYIRGCEDKVVLVTSLYLEHKRVGDFLIFTAMHLPAKECQQTPDARRDNEEFAYGFERDLGPLPTHMRTSCFQSCETPNFCCFKYPICGILCKKHNHRF